MFPVPAQNSHSRGRAWILIFPSKDRLTEYGRCGVGRSHVWTKAPVWAVRVMFMMVTACVLGGVAVLPGERAVHCTTVHVGFCLASPSSIKVSLS